jgi:hypothetical protein
MMDLGRNEGCSGRLRQHVACRARDVRALAEQSLLGAASLWARWFARVEERVRVNPVAAFNDAGRRVQAAEHDMGLALARELLAADALRDGPWSGFSPVTMADVDAYAFWLVYPSALGRRAAAGGIAHLAARRACALAAGAGEDQCWVPPQDTQAGRECSAAVFHCSLQMIRFIMTPA